MAEALHAETFGPFIRESKTPVLVDFYQDGCVPCRRVAPLLHRAGEAYSGRLTIARVNLGQNLDLAKQLNIEATPTLVLFQNGTEAARLRGVITQADLDAMLQAALNQEKGENL